MNKITSLSFTETPSTEESYNLLNSIVERQNDRNFSPHKIDKPLILYGAGNLGKMAKDYFKKLNIPFLFVIDKNSNIYENDPIWKGINVIDNLNVPIQIKQRSLLVICIANKSYSEVGTQLETEGWKDIVPFYNIAEAYTNQHPLGSGWCTKLTDKDITNIKSIIPKWEDDTSRSHYLQFIAWHVLREEWIFNNTSIVPENRYFIPEILTVLNDKESFVDIGSHHGEVIKKFLDVTQNKFNKIYAYEPDIKNFQKLHHNLNTHIHTNKNIHLLCKALFSTEEEKLFYSNLGYMSQLSHLGKIKLDTHTLDSQELSPTFIKIHTEGSESSIINGSIQTIMKHNPIMTVTTYHNRDGLWRIPFQLMTYLKNHIFYFRLHSWYGTGSVIYAIPKERLNK